MAHLAMPLLAGGVSIANQIAELSSTRGADRYQTLVDEAKNIVIRKVAGALNASGGGTTAPGSANSPAPKRQRASQSSGPEFITPARRSRPVLTDISPDRSVPVAAAGLAGTPTTWHSRLGRALGARSRGKRRARRGSRRRMAGFAGW